MHEDHHRPVVASASRRRPSRAGSPSRPAARPPRQRVEPDQPHRPVLDARCRNGPAPIATPLPASPATKAARRSWLPGIAAIGRSKPASDPATGVYPPACRSRPDRRSGARGPAADRAPPPAPAPRRAPPPDRSRRAARRASTCGSEIWAMSIGTSRPGDPHARRGGQPRNTASSGGKPLKPTDE